ncbi:MAG: flagellar biosynthesis protein FlhF [Planctomycetes bacterium]|nr:flagellar biosynthesis protein FlhF [Planctomycetota bacterium]
MKIKKYEGRTWDEAIAKVKADLGPGAVLLHTQLPQERHWLRLWGGGKCVILAGTGFHVVSEYRQRRPASGDTSRIVVRPAGGSAPATVGVPAKAAAPALREAPAADPGDLGVLRRMVQELRDNVLYPDFAQAPEGLRIGYRSLIENRISTTLARRVLTGIQQKIGAEACANAELVREAIRETIAERVNVAHEIRLTPGRSRVVALIGPTGVGKTTTIAKLAAIYALRRQKRVGLITMDTYRIAATEQLSQMADIARIPLRIAKTPEEVNAAVAEFARFDLVLIDSAGRAQRNADHLRELKHFIDVAKPDEIHLVLSVTSNLDVLYDVVERFGCCRIDNIILTKLDEAVRFGLILDVLEKVRSSVSYVTTGQGVPADIEPADRERLVSMICGDGIEHGSGRRASSSGPADHAPGAGAGRLLG